MPRKPAKKPAKKSARKATAKPAKPERKPRAVDRALAPEALPEIDMRTVVHGCIARCAGHSGFGPTTQLRSIVAPAECVRLCILQATGRNLLISGTDHEDLIVAML